MNNDDNHLVFNIVRGMGIVVVMTVMSIVGGGKEGKEPSTPRQRHFGAAAASERGWACQGLPQFDFLI